jgi:hypothetical protein
MPDFRFEHPADRSSAPAWITLWVIEAGRMLPQARWRHTRANRAVSKSSVRTVGTGFPPRRFFGIQLPLREGLKLPVVSISPEEAGVYYGWLAFRAVQWPP